MNSFGQAESEFIGSKSCQGCHEEAFNYWQNSHHDLAMQPASENTVLGDFNGVEFDYHGSITRFSNDDSGFWVTTQGPDGILEKFPVEYVFGVYPLQQYLIPLAGGRLQALTIAWDARPQSEGGQRWYHLYPDEFISHSDPLHWTGPYHNWNARCAECHSTNVRKNYNVETDSYDTSYSEIDVGCEACHSAGRAHIEAVEQGRVGEVEHGGFEVSLKGNMFWERLPGASVASSSKKASPMQVENCGRCHSRRRTLGDYRYGHSLLDTHSLAMLSPPLYHPDGQIRDEVYVYGSFIQSKMYDAGVVCTNCHEPHSNQLKVEGNALCGQCHNAGQFDTPDHHRHSNSSEGAQCVNCHMPEQVYMGVDKRRDHSMRIPRPDISIQIGSPNACIQCHTSQSNEWAVDALLHWGMETRDGKVHIGVIFDNARKGDPTALSKIHDLALDPNNNAIWRGTAAELLGQYRAVKTGSAANELLQSANPLLRASAVRSTENLPLVQRFRILQPHLNETNDSVIMEIARVLSEIPLAQIPPADASVLTSIFNRYLNIQSDHLDLPSVQVQLGNFYSKRGYPERAESAYRAAIRINPQVTGAYINLADLKRSEGDDVAAGKILFNAVKRFPTDADILHALGLLEIRRKNYDAALEFLKSASAYASDNIQYRYIYAVALHDLGQAERSIKELEAALNLSAYSSNILLALVAYSLELEQYPQAKTYSERLVSLDPLNNRYLQLYQDISAMSDN